MAASKKVDYDLIEPDWRAGIKTPAQLAAEYTKATGIKVSRVAIIKHFDKIGVPRDLRAKIQAKAEAMVAESMVTGMVSTKTKNRDIEVIEVNAQKVALIRTSHQSSIGRGRNVTMKLLAELESQTDNQGLYAQLQELLHDPIGDDDGPAAKERHRKRLEVFDKAMSLGSRTSTMKALAESLSKLVALEREAYGISSSPGEADDPLAQLLHGFKARTIQPVADDPDLLTA